MIFGALETENIDFSVFQGQKVLIFGALETENIDFWWSRGGSKGGSWRGRIPDGQARNPGPPKD